MLRNEYDGGEYTVVVGQVTALGVDSGRSPLLFHRGGYGVS